MRTRSIIGLLVYFGVLFQTSVAFAVASEQNSFENAWQEASTSTEYSFSCTTSSSSPKAKSTTNLTADQKKLIKITLAAIKKYKNTTLGALIGADSAVSSTQEKVNTLGALDAAVAGSLTADQTEAALKKVIKQKVQFVLLDNRIYFKGGAGWQTFEHAEFAKQLMDALIAEPIVSALEKSTFVFKSRSKSGVNEEIQFTGKLAASHTAKMLTPFMGEESAKGYSPLPAKLYISGDGHIKKYTVNSKVVVGGLSFTIKESCKINFNKTQIKAPKGAKEVDADTGLKGIVELAQQ